MEGNRDLIQNQVQKNLNAIQPTSDSMTQAVKSMERGNSWSCRHRACCSDRTWALSHKAEISIGWKKL